MSERFVVTLEAAPGGTARDLARLLKRLGRWYGLRVVSFRRVKPRKAAA